ncbi:hypothetical protein SAMN05421880_1324 [Nitrosomonas nitrosa]|uniref:DNA-3-methyladenine glycosylase 2 family protein n=1 Tax=Nitrosomonas nitrosa TaxID=52442 RepID=A0A1I4THI7_9PROT|nr:hypothetical protein [Nitrosomonas nitrosa]SFM76152.1 hypothetical protein SAMN05421880_1324 [Nitrosomonas nitrosa]
MISSLAETTILDFFRIAETTVIKSGYGWEIDWQKTLSFSRFSESDFIRETAWVILCSGFRESTVRNNFDYISLCFCDWESAKEIVAHQHVCLSTARSAFKNDKKLNAIIKVAETVCETGFHNFKKSMQEDPIQKLQELPFIGPITSWHLAKNLGLNVAKNDRHLARMALNWGYSDAHEFCKQVSKLTGEPASVVDIILWRFAAIRTQNSHLRILN